MFSGSLLSDSDDGLKSDNLRKLKLSEVSFSPDSSNDYLKYEGANWFSDTNMVLTENTDQFIIGDRVWVGGLKPGQIAYIGETQFAPGEWAGVVLDEPIGKNDGTVANIRYFQCEPKKGIFSRLTRLTKYPLSDGGAGETAATKSVYNEIKKSNGTLADSLTKKSPLSLTPDLNLKHTPTKPSSFDSNIHPTPSLAVGDRVIIKSSQGSKAGILKYIGTTEFAPGEWCGVELDDPLGKNDGSVNGVRYFECQPKFGLFAPLNKISKSPANKRLFQPCMVHPNRTSSLRRYGSKESLMSVSSTASKTASVKSTNKKIGVKTPTSSTVKITLQESLKKKELEIEQLLRERDLERIEVTRAASQADEAERQLKCTKKEFENYKTEVEVHLAEMNTLISQIRTEKNELLNQLDDEKKKFEDLQFRFEEEMIDKADIKSKMIQYEENNNLLQKNLADERKRIEFLEHDSNKLFETEEQMVFVKDELDTTKEELEKIRSVRLALEQEHISLEAHLTAARAEIKSLQAQNNSLKEITLNDKNGLKECLTESIQNLKKELSTKNELLEQLSKENEEKNFRLLDIEKELKEKFQTTIQELSEKYNGELSSLKNDFKKTETIKNLNDTAVKNFEEKNAKINDILEKKEFELKQLNDELIKIKDEFDIKFKESNELHQLREKKLTLTIKNLEDDEKQKKTDFEKQREYLETLKRSLESKENELKSEVENNKILTEKLLTMEENYKKMENDKTEAQLENEKIKKKLLSTEKELDYANNQKAKLNTNISTLINSSKDSSLVLNKLNEELKLKEKEVDTLQKEIFEKTVNFDQSEQELKQQIEKQKETLQSFEICHHNELKALKDKIKSFADEKEKVENEWKEKIEIVSNNAKKSIMDLEERLKIEKEENLDEKNKYEAQIKELIKVQKKLELKLHNITEEAINSKSCSDKQIQELKVKCATLLEAAETAKANTLLIEKKLEDQTIKDTESRTNENNNQKIELKKTKESLFKVEKDLQKALDEKNKLNKNNLILEKIRTDIEKRLSESQDKCSKLAMSISSIEIENKILKETINQFRNENCSAANDATEKALPLAKHTEQVKCFEKPQKASIEEGEIKTQYLEEKILNLQQFLNNTETLSFENILNEGEQVKNLERDVKKFDEESSQSVFKKEKDTESVNLLLAQIQKELNESKSVIQRKSESIRNLEKKINYLSEELKIEKKQKENLQSKCLDFEKELFKLNEKCKGQSQLFASNTTLQKETAKINNKFGESEIGEKELFDNNEAEKENFFTELESTKTFLGQKELETQNSYVKLDGLKKRKFDSERKEKVMEQTTKDQSNIYSSANNVLNEPDFEKDQIDFLNSVIVDMQKKNDALKARIEILEMGYSPEDVEEFNLHNINARSVVPRLFCDICDRFDLHDTDDCPAQAESETLPLYKSSKTKVLPPQRLYCDICEIFGHDAADCDAAETF